MSSIEGEEGLGMRLWQHSYSLKVFIVFVAPGLPFSQVHLSVRGGGGGGGKQAYSYCL